MRPGDIVADRFEIELRAGSGAMGAVYRARDRDGGGAVALKVIAGQGLQSEERFAREAEILADLLHPAIVRYVTHGATEAGERFLAMEWIDGESLSERLV